MVTRVHAGVIQIMQGLDYLQFRTVCLLQSRPVARNYSPRWKQRIINRRLRFRIDNGEDVCGFDCKLCSAEDIQRRLDKAGSLIWNRLRMGVPKLRHECLYNSRSILSVSGRVGNISKGKLHQLRLSGAAQALVSFSS